MASDTTAVREAAAVFAALGEPHRLGLLARLGQEGPQSIARLTEGSDITRQGVSKHLRALERAGLARSARRGREQVWELQVQGFAQAHGCLDQIAAHWSQAAERRRVFVET